MHGLCLSLKSCAPPWAESSRIRLGESCAAHDYIHARPRGERSSWRSQTLRSWKMSWNMLTAMCDFMVLPRCEGHKSTWWTACCGRRASGSFTHATRSVPREDRSMDRFRDFSVENHAFHNGIKLGLGQWSAQGLSDTVHITIANCTNCGAGIHASTEDALLRIFLLRIRRALWKTAQRFGLFW